MIEGTCNFSSFGAAEEYFKRYGYSRNDVQQKVSDGEIVIGPPKLGPGETLQLIPGEGRYQIVYPLTAPQVPVSVAGNEMQLLTVIGNQIHLPSVRLMHYSAIKDKLETAGGRYKQGGYFEFEAGVDVSDILSQLQGGGKVNLKKDFQFFSSPTEIAIDLCDELGDLRGRRVLEPSAGDGVLADEAKSRGAEVVTIELWSLNVLKLRAKGYDVIERDFLSVLPEEIGLFDAIVANPPFTSNADIDHVMHMVKFLKPGGLLSVVMSKSWISGRQRKQVAFREFLAERQVVPVEIAAGAFKHAGTSISTVRLVIPNAVDQQEFRLVA